MGINCCTYNGPVKHCQPYTPQKGDLRRCDSIVERYNSTTKKWETILFYEAKLDFATPEEVHLCEVQAFSAFWAFLHHFPERKIIYAMTTWGTKARLWSLRAGETALVAYFPQGEACHPNLYIEASSDTAAGLKKAFRLLRKWDDSVSAASGSVPSGLDSASDPTGELQINRESTVSSQETASSAGRALPPVFVDTWCHVDKKKSHVYYKFRHPDTGRDIKTEGSDWKAGHIPGDERQCSIYTEKVSGRQFYL
ncbi:hypothetical protein SBOR_7735 [Sclerotinia borealis F-4128]|uniref:Uncharacterized protein n=1 Tax=Sclerotinia borealis (strain F-4128) TaxID=1432307 RepID=W9CBG2_SCLBF|nr:hypothetical protein SBOR_7735 [Sclerotinia borealis F-4128]